MKLTLKTSKCTVTSDGYLTNHHYTEHPVTVDIEKVFYDGVAYRAIPTAEALAEMRQKGVYMGMKDNMTVFTFRKKDNKRGIVPVLPANVLWYPPEQATRAEEFIRTTGFTSVSALQRRFKIDYWKADELMKTMEDLKVVTPIDDQGRRTIIEKVTP
jgi:hypothetical protein